MFEDKRSKRVILLAHCILNQNAKLDRCAHYPGAIREAAQLLIDSGVGLIQMPCPELACLGLARQAIAEGQATVEEEDTRIAVRMAEERAKDLCLGIAESLVSQVEEYQRNGFKVLGAVGINGSPTCGVETSWSDNRETEEMGVFLRILFAGFERRGIVIPMRGIKAYEPERAAQAISELLGK